MDQTQMLAIALLGLVLVACGAILALRMRRWNERRRSTRRAAIAQRGEDVAQKILRRAGYQIEGRQAVGAWSAVVDGHTVTGQLRVDYLVTKGGQRFAAEVKTGAAADLRKASTRRQLLEYLHAFDVDDLLLVDASNGHVHTVVFPTPSGLTRAIIFGAFAASLIGYAWFRAVGR